MSDARWVIHENMMRVYDPRDRDEHDSRDGLMRNLDFPRGDERELRR